MYIKREAAIHLLHYHADEACSAVVTDFEAIPAADVVEVRRGEWVGTTCSACGKVSPTIYMNEGTIEYEIIETPFCPNCGADMRGEKNGN